MSFPPSILGGPLEKGYLADNSLKMRSRMKLWREGTLRYAKRNRHKENGKTIINGLHSQTLREWPLRRAGSYR